MRDTSPKVSRLFIPDRELWTPEAADYFLDDDGRLRVEDDGTPGFEPIPVPLIDESNYPIVDIPALVRSLNGLFVENSPFPVLLKRDVENKLEEDEVERTNEQDGYIRTGDNVDHVQEQKFFREGRRVVNMAAYRFCDLPERKVRMPWLVHNAKTHIFEDAPAIDDQQFMNDHVTGAVWSLAMLEAAIMMERRGHGFNARKKSLSTDSIVPGTPMEIRTHVDVQSADHFRGLSEKTKELYKATMWLYFEKVPEESYFRQFVEPVTNSRPKAVASILQEVVTADAWDYSAYLRGKVSMDQARNTQQNRYARQVIRDSRLIA